MRRLPPSVAISALNPTILQRSEEVAATERVIRLCLSSVDDVSHSYRDMRHNVPMEFIAVNEVPEDAQLVDVRSDMEWNDGHAPNAIHIPMEQIPARFGELDLDSDIYLICRSGGRSAQVGQWLEQNGIDTVNVSGGMIDWEHAGRPIVTG